MPSSQGQLQPPRSKLRRDGAAGSQPWGNPRTRSIVAAAGAGRSRCTRDALLASLRLRTFPRRRPHVAVEDDTRVALRAALPEGPGIVVIAGTGSVAYAEHGSTRTARVGGAGYLLGDEGSAFAIGLAAT
jgi:glucosamine kinase